MQGWIKLHRKLLNWEWYHDSKVVHLFLHLVLRANHQDKQWKGITIKRGQLVTGRKALSSQTGISEQSIRTSLKKLKSTNEITIKPTNRFSLITVCQYDTYNNNESGANQQTPNKQPTTNQQLTTNKNVKKVKKDNKLLCEFDIARKLFKGSKNGLDPEWENFTRKHSSYKSIVPLLLPAIEKEIAWRAAADGIKDYFVPQWKNFQTWINHSCWTQELPYLNSKQEPSTGCSLCEETGVATHNRRWYCKKHLKQERGY